MTKILGPLEDVYNDNEVSEIFVDSFDDVYIEKNGKIINLENIFKNQNEVELLIEKILASQKKSISDIQNGFTTLTLKDSSRIAITLEAISISSPTITIRKHFRNNFSFDDLKKFKAINEDGQQICEQLLKKDKNILIIGNTGSGKTTLTNIITDLIDKRYRLVTVEQVGELDTSSRKRTIRLRTPNSKNFEMSELISNASKLRVDTMVINELKGKEVYDALNIMSEGVHVISLMAAESVHHAIKKCELLCLSAKMGLNLSQIKYQISQSIDVIIFQERLGNGRRVVTNISTLSDLDQNDDYSLSPLFGYDEDSENFFTTDAGKLFVK